VESLVQLDGIRVENQRIFTLLGGISKVFFVTEYTKRPQYGRGTSHLTLFLTTKLTQIFNCWIMSSFSQLSGWKRKNHLRPSPIIIGVVILKLMVY